MAITGIGTTGYEIGEKIVYTAKDGSQRFDKELVKAGTNSNVSFATPITKEELFRQWDEQVEANQDKKMAISEMLAARPFAKELMYSMVGSSKVYTFDEYVKEMEKRIQELSMI